VPDQPRGSRDTQSNLVLAQAGLEMVAPIGIGVLLDSYFSCRPWGTVAGVVIGLVGGIAHIVYVVNHQGEDPPRPGSGAA
jgi:F0F1-type ATP synthase assembly protein I